MIIDRRSLLKWFGIGSGIGLVGEVQAGEPEHTISSYSFAEKVGSSVVCYAQIRCEGMRYVFTCRLPAENLARLGQEKLIRKTLDDLRNKALLLPARLAKERNQHLHETELDLTPVPDLSVESLHCFVQTRLDEFREVHPESDRLGTVVDEKGWSRDFNCYL